MRKITIIILILLASFRIFANGPQKFTICGYIKDKSNGEMLIGSSVYIKELQVGTVTNVYGFYSISLPQGKYTIVYSFLGYNSIVKTIDLKTDIKINIELELKATNLKEVIVSSRKADENVSNVQMSIIKLEAKTIKSIPAMLGEVDVLKAIQLLPGVQTASEGMSGFSVRGGNLDQNLMLIDEATVYNASHLMGFISVFNNDAIKDITFYKGDIPAQYGGRLSSLVDIRMRDGNMKKYSATGGIGTISSRLTIEGPIVKDKSSFLLSGRRSYADLILLASSEMKDTKLHFYDLNLKLNYIINDKNRFYFSSYMGRDIVGMDKLLKINWGNATESFRWNHLFSKKLFANISLLSSNYDYYMGYKDSIIKFKWVAKMKDYSLKTDFSYYFNTNNTIKFGFISTYHCINPGTVIINSQAESQINFKFQENKSVEHGFFVSNEQKIDSVLSFNYGLRLSVFQRMGADTIYDLDKNYNLIEWRANGKGDIYQTYQGLEPRIGIKYKVGNNTSLKACYSRTNQYLNLASLSSAGLPVDIWLASSKNIKPQIADLYAIGYFRNIKQNSIETSVEVYYKNMKNAIDFKDNANLILNPIIEGELRFGKARSYGAEFMMRKQEGKLNGWISYTYSRALQTIKEINKGYEYSSNYDKPHNFSIVLNYILSTRVSISANWVYISGMVGTFPTGRFEYGNILVPVVSERNGYRFRDYHRLDLALTLKNKEKNRKYNWDLNFSIYNVYNRHNIWWVDLKQDELISDKINATNRFFPFLPSITYNFHF